MKRYYSHYTFIYPDIYVKNYIVEMDDNRKIIRIFPYDKEVEKTEFHSGLLIFLPDNIPFRKEMQENIRKSDFSKQGRCLQWEDSPYRIFKED
ncbi:hypothetical protein FACS1894179_02370 [Bacteroidia bacterium]|nr:hypothetical protein FACS1894179_02370 [Bacteroidia bacterium]